MMGVSGQNASSIKQIIQAFDDRAIQVIKQHTKAELLNELMSEVKRMPR